MITSPPFVSDLAHVEKWNLRWTVKDALLHRPRHPWPINLLRDVSSHQEIICGAEYFSLVRMSHQYRHFLFSCREFEEYRPPYRRCQPRCFSATCPHGGHRIYPLRPTMLHRP